LPLLAGDHRLLIVPVFEAGFVIEFDLIDLAHERAIVVRGVRRGDRCVGRRGRLVLRVPDGFAQRPAQQGRNLILVQDVTGPRPAGGPWAPWGGAEHLSGRWWR
jgi:hypothetical protein